MSGDVDTTHLVGGPINRRGGKGLNARPMVPHFARATVYAESCLGGGSVLFALPPGAYAQRAVNDLDDDVVTFFRELRDHGEEFKRECLLTPYARSEFAAALERNPLDSPRERARKMWVRGRQGFAGKAETIGDWGRNPGGDCGAWNPSRALSKLDAFDLFTASLQGVAIDCVDAEAFIDTWGREGTFLYSDFPYLPETRRSNNDYRHEMTEADHRRMAAAHHRAIERGCKVAVSGYPSRLYDEELYPAWRKVEADVPLRGTRDAAGMRRTEVLWCSYHAEDALGYVAPSRQGELFGGAR